MYIYNLGTPFWAVKMISVALDFRAFLDGESLNLNNEMKKLMKQKGVTDRIRHFRLSRIKNSILFMVLESNIIPPTSCS